MLRLCYKSFFWTAFCIFEHNCIACLAAVIDSRSVTWCEFRSPLLFCFLSNTQALDCIVLVYWMYGCKCIISNNNFVLCHTGKSMSLLLILFFHNLFEELELTFFPNLEPSEVTHVTHVNGSFKTYTIRMTEEKMETRDCRYQCPNDSKHPVELLWKDKLEIETESREEF